MLCAEDILTGINRYSTSVLGISDINKSQSLNNYNGGIEPGIHIILV